MPVCIFFAECLIRLRELGGIRWHYYNILDSILAQNWKKYINREIRIVLTD